MPTKQDIYVFVIPETRHAHETGFYVFIIPETRHAHETGYYGFIIPQKRHTHQKGYHFVGMTRFWNNKNVNILFRGHDAFLE
jgi:hypothetical protein